MKHFLNVGHCQFNLVFLGSAQEIIGTMVDCDETGVTILIESSGEYHSYAIGVVQHVCLAP